MPFPIARLYISQNVNANPHLLELYLDVCKSLPAHFFRMSMPPPSHWDLTLITKHHQSYPNPEISMRQPRSDGLAFTLLISDQVSILGASRWHPLFMGSALTFSKTDPISIPKYQCSFLSSRLNIEVSHFGPSSRSEQFNAIACFSKLTLTFET